MAKQGQRRRWLGLSLLVVVVGTLALGAWLALRPAPAHGEPDSGFPWELVLQGVGTVIPAGTLWLKLRTATLNREKLSLEVEQLKLENLKIRGELEAPHQA